MSEPKQPQDHKPKAEKVPPPDAKREIEYDGQTYTIDPESFTDVDFMDLLADMEEKPYYLPRVVRYMLGDQWQRFTASHTGDNGKCGAVQLDAFFEAANQQLSLGN